jgi:hypothetical protein
MVSRTSERRPHMKALETGTTLATAVAAATVTFVLAALAVGGVVAAAAGYGCW